MNTISAVAVFTLLTIKSVAGVKPDYWHAPLLTLYQIKEHLVIGQTREDVLRAMPFNTGAATLPHSGALNAQTVIFFPKNEDSIVFSQGLFCLFEDDSEILLKEPEAWEPRYMLFTQLRRLSSLRRELIDPSETRTSRPPRRKTE